MSIRRASLLVLALSIGGTGIVLAQDAAERAIASRLPQDYVALRERPLFSPDRRPPAPPPVEAPPPAAEPPPPEPVPVAEAPDWELIGVVRSQRVNSALFRAPGEPASFSLRQGESRDGWTLAEVNRFEVSLENGGGRAKLRFPERSGGAGALPAGMPSLPSPGGPRMPSGGALPSPPPPPPAAAPMNSTPQIINESGAAVSLPTVEAQ